MPVTQVEQRDVVGGVEVSATVDGFRLWYRFPQVHWGEPRADWLVSSLLIPAMVVGKPLILPESSSVSPRLVRGVTAIQSILHAWNPTFKKISIEGARSCAAAEAHGVAAFFSGGIDGTYTFLRHSDEVQHLILINGFDFRSDANTFSLIVERNRRFAERLGKTLVPVETNYIDLGRKYKISRAATYGGLLASVGLGIGFRRTYIAASYGYADLPPHGTNPMLDHLWNTETNEFIHDGAEVSRSSKLAVVAQSKEALNNLRVCWNDANYNCGECSKCLRTMIALRLLGHDERRYFAKPLTMRALRDFRIADASTRGYALDNLELSERVGNAPIAKALQRRIWQYDARRLMVDVDRVLLGGVVRKAKSWCRAEAPPDVWPSAKVH